MVTATNEHAAFSQAFYRRPLQYYKLRQYLSDELMDIDNAQSYGPLDVAEQARAADLSMGLNLLDSVRGPGRRWS